MSKPVTNGNTSNSNSYVNKTFVFTGYYVPDEFDGSEALVTAAHNHWSPAGVTGTSSNDFFYIGQASGEAAINYSLAGPTINGGKGADQLILLGAVNVTDDFFTNMVSIEVLKLGQGEASSATLDVQALEAGIREVTGSDADDSISFGAAYDSGPTSVTASAGAGDDTISAGAGDDRLTGGSGADVLSGGDGSDVFVLASGSGNTTASIDEIVDLGAGDTIKTGVAAGVSNYVELAGLDFGATVGSLEAIIAAADSAFATLAAGATQYAVVANGSTDAASVEPSPAATTASYLVIDWDGDNSADQAVLLTGVIDLDQISVATIVA